MRLSRTLFTSLRSVAATHESESHRLLLRAGYLRQLGQGLFSALPLGQASLSAVEGILRAEMTALGCHEVSMPVVLPAALWESSGRAATVGPELARFTDRRDRPMLLAMTHEEAAAAMCRDVVSSYRQLPASVFQIQTKFRDDPRPRAGLIRVREFRMKDAYSFAADDAGLQEQYAAFEAAYHRIFDRCELPVRQVRADVGIMGGAGAHEFMYATPVGEDTVVLCPSCGYAANGQVAESASPRPVPETPQPIEAVPTAGADTVHALARSLDITTDRVAKAVMYCATLGDGAEAFVFAVVTGDKDVNESKLARAVGAVALRPATDEQIRAHGAEPGYASPIGLREAVVVADPGVRDRPNLVAGANEPGVHLRNVTLGRDFEATVADIVTARAGDPCAHCGGRLQTERAVEVANTFRLGTRYSEALGATYRTSDGDERAVVMGSYGIGVGRLLACIAEEHHDDSGLCWPESVAPARVHLVPLGAAGAQPAEELYTRLAAAGIATVLDDRDERAGVKLTDADLIGCPVRVVVGARSLERGGAEVRDRRSGAGRIVPLDTPVESLFATG